MTRSSARIRGATMVEYIIIVGVVALASIAAYTTFGEDTKQLSTTQSQCIDAMACAKGSSFPSSSVDSNATTGSGAKGASAAGSSSGSGSGGSFLGSVWSGTKTAAGAVWSFGKGFVVDGAWGTVKGLATFAWSLATHPVDTTVGMAKGIAYVATHPVTVAKSVGHEIAQEWKQDPARLLGNGVFQLASLAVPVSKVGTATKAAEVAGDTAKAAEAAEVAAKAAEAAAEAAKDAAKASVAAREAAQSGLQQNGWSVFDTRGHDVNGHVEAFQKAVQPGERKSIEKLEGLSPEAKAAAKAWGDDMLKQMQQSLPGEELEIDNIAVGRGFSAGRGIVHADQQGTYLHSTMTIEGDSTIVFPEGQYTAAEKASMTGQQSVSREGMRFVDTSKLPESQKEWAVQVDPSVPRVTPATGESVVISGADRRAIVPGTSSTMHASPMTANPDRVTLFLSVRNKNFEYAGGGKVVPRTPPPN